MKKYLVIMGALLSLPMLDYAAAGFHYSLSDTAEAYVARRSAFVAQGPEGGVVVGTRRTAFGRPGYGFLEDERFKQVSENKGLTEFDLQRSEDSDKLIKDPNEGL